MSDKRTVTIGVTINLGNYESLRLEVSDIAETKSDAGELRRFLSDVLDDFGNNNATAKSAVEKYKDRILSDSGSEVIEEIEDTQEPVSEIMPNLFLSEEPEQKDESEAAADLTDTFEKEIAESRPPLLSDVLKTEEEKPEPEAEENPLFIEIEHEPVKEPEPEPEPPKVSVPISKPSEGEYTCEKCGAKISKVQRDVSNLFMGKSLCKNCMK